MTQKLKRIRHKKSKQIDCMTTIKHKKQNKKQKTLNSENDCYIIILLCFQQTSNLTKPNIDGFNILGRKPIFFVYYETLLKFDRILQF